MLRLVLVCRALLFLLTPRLAADEPAAKEAVKPPYERSLKGEDAKHAAELEKKANAFVAADNYDAAIKLYEQLLELRTRLQGADHWETVNWKWLLDREKKVANLSAEKRAGWRAARRDTFTAQALQAKGQFARALPLRETYSKWCREVLGEEHPDTAGSFSSLAFNLNAQGKFAEAEPLFRKALAIYIKALGEEHPNTALSFNNLAFNLNARGKLAEAELLYRKALAIFTKALGEEHPDTARSFSNVGVNLNAQGKFAEAEPLLGKALAIAIKALGEENPGTTQSLNNVAMNLNAQGKYAQAEPLLRKALAIRIKALGEEHPDTALSFSNFAVNLNAQGKFAEAEPLYRKALAIHTKALGEEHPDTARSYSNVAANLAAQGKFAEAEPLYRKALAIRTKALGEEHPDTAMSLNFVAVNLNSQGKYAEAEQLHRKALAIFIKALGAEHPTTALSYNDLAVNLSAQAKFAEAEPLYRKALAIYTKALGEEHPATATSCNNLAVNLNNQGKFAKAEPLYRKALAIRAKAGEEHRDTAASYNNVAGNLNAQGKFAEAEPLYRKALAIFIKVLGEEHPDTALSYMNVAVNLSAQGKFTEAEPLLERAVHAFEASRLAVAVQGLDRAEFGIDYSPYLLLATTRARLNRFPDAWTALEANLARGLLDQVGPASGKPDEEARRRELAGKLAAIEPRLLRLAAAPKRSAAEQTELDALVRERNQAASSLAALDGAISKRQVASLAQFQAALPGDAAWIGWLDVADKSGIFREHWACVVRGQDEPHWEKLPGSGPDGAWTKDDSSLPDRLGQELESTTGAAATIADLARRVHTQRLAPTAKHLQGVKRLFVSSTGKMAGIPVEELTDKYTISYVPSGTFLARLKDKPAASGSGLLALGDPIFKRPEGGAKQTELPPGGLLILNVVSGGPGAKAGLKDGDVLVEYAGSPLTSVEQLLKLIEAKALAHSIEAKLWRDSETSKLNTRKVPPGKLGVVLDKRPAPQAIADRRKADELLVASRADKLADLPGTRVEVSNLAKLFGKEITLLVDSAASEQRLEELRTSGALAKFRYLHFGTHGAANDVKAFESVLYLAQDLLPKELVSEPGKPFINGELSAREVLKYWKLNAELVTLSACETALGRSGGGDGLLGFAQAFLTAGSRSVCLSLWKVDDAATTLLMDRFYKNLLGKRDGLTQALSKAEALAEAKNWLRNLSYDEVVEQTAALTQGVARGKDQPALKIVTPEKPKGEAGGAKPFAHPRYWAAFILIGDPN
jgi:CHAT domain-containing protein/tetratricopeptide (TPR) repeat protein